MEISKEWNGETVENKVWTRPGEESCFYAKKWKEEGKKTILDLGSGLGRHSIFFAKHGFRVTAVERSQYGVHFLKEWQKREGVDILVKKTDMSHLPFSDNAFDCVWAYDSTAHTDAKGIEKILDEVKRILKPEGCIYFTLHSKATEPYADSDLSGQEANTGFKTVEQGKNGPYYFADLKDVQNLLYDFTINQIRLVEDCELENKRKSATQYYIDATLHKIGSTPDYSHIIGTTVKGKIDRPLGSAHPRIPTLVYKVNYGFVENVFAPDGAEQDIYLMGIDYPVEAFEGEVIAVIHRRNDIEDKWIVTQKGKISRRKKYWIVLCFKKGYLILNCTDKMYVLWSRNSLF